MSNINVCERKTWQTKDVIFELSSLGFPFGLILTRHRLKENSTIKTIRLTKDNAWSCFFVAISFYPRWLQILCSGLPSFTLENLDECLTWNLKLQQVFNLCSSKFSSTGILKAIFFLENLVLITSSIFLVVITQLPNKVESLTYFLNWNYSDFCFV